MKFNSIGQSKILKMENERQLKAKKQGSIINKEDIAKAGGASQVAKTYLRQTR